MAEQDPLYPIFRPTPLGGTPRTAPTVAAGYLPSIGRRRSGLLGALGATVDAAAAVPDVASYGMDAFARGQQALTEGIIGVDEPITASPTLPDMASRRRAATAPPTSNTIGDTGDEFPTSRVTEPSYAYTPAKGIEMNVPLEKGMEFTSSGAPRMGGGNLEGLSSRVMTAEQSGPSIMPDILMAAREGNPKAIAFLEARQMEKAEGGGGDPRAEEIKQAQQDYALEQLQPATAPRPAERWGQRIQREETERRRTSLQTELSGITAQQGTFFKQRAAEIMASPEYQAGDDMVRQKLIDRARADSETFADRLEQRIIAREAALAGKVPGQYFQQ